MSLNITNPSAPTFAENGYDLFIFWSAKKAIPHHQSTADVNANVHGALSCKGGNAEEHLHGLPKVTLLDYTVHISPNQ